MNRKNESCINLVVFLILILAVPSYAADPDLDWKTLKSDHFRIHFHEGEQALAEKVAFLCENTHARLSVTFSWEPENRTDVVLSDEMDLRLDIFLDKYNSAQYW